MSPNFFFNVVAPTFVTEGVAFVGITTLGEDVKGKDEVNQLFSMKTESGRSIMRTIVMDQVCDECKAKGTIGTCQHKMGELPYWQDPRRRQQLAQMMSKDHYESYMRETQGVLVNSMSQNFFDAETLRKLLDTNTFHRGVITQVSHIFVSVDPAAGGDKSRYAIVSAVYPRHGEMLVIGGECANYREPEEQMRLLVSHIQKLRQVPGLESAIIVFVPESNLAFEGTHQSNVILNSGLSNVCIMREDDNRAGVRMDNSLKKAMATAFKYKLNKGKVRFLYDFVSLGEKKVYDDVRNEIVEELVYYTRIVKPSKDPFEQPKEIFSGKKGYGTDDLAIAIMLNLIMERRFYASDKYKKWRSG